MRAFLRVLVEGTPRHPDGEERRFGAALDLSAAAADILTAPLLPGFEIPVAEIFGQTA
jgi:hypothetical protein